MSGLDSFDKSDHDYSGSFFSVSNDYDDGDEGDFEGCSGCLKGCLSKIKTIVIAIIFLYLLGLVLSLFQ